MNQSWRIFVMILLTFAEVNSITDFELYNCSEIIPLLRHEFYNDHILLSQVSAENDHFKSLLKYVQYSLNNLNKFFKQKCPLYSGVIKEQVAYCPTKPLYASCTETMRYNSGVYSLRSKVYEDSEESFLAYCLEDEIGGHSWTVIQRRVGNDCTFNQTWAEYENGFGNIDRSYWLGFKKLCALMNGSSYELWISLKDFDNATQYAKYDNFVLGDLSKSYAILSLGQYTGTAGNSLKDSVGVEFSTYDSVNDGSVDCAKTTNGGWWFTNCGESNLNGEYYTDVQPISKGRGVFWNGWRGLYYSYAYTHMAIRERTSREL